MGDLDKSALPNLNYDDDLATHHPLPPLDALHSLRPASRPLLPQPRRPRRPRPDTKATAAPPATRHFRGIQGARPRWDAFYGCQHACGDSDATRNTATSGRIEEGFSGLCNFGTSVRPHSGGYLNPSKPFKHRASFRIAKVDKTGHLPLYLHRYSGACYTFRGSPSSVLRTCPRFGDRPSTRIARFSIDGRRLP